MHDSSFDKVTENVYFDLCITYNFRVKNKNVKCKFCHQILSVNKENTDGMPNVNKMYT